MKVRLGDVCSFFSGTGFPNIYQGQKTGKYPIYKVGDISKNVLFGNRELIFSDNYIDDDTVKAIKGTVLPPKTVVFAKIGEALKQNRRAITGCYCLIDNNAMGILADNSVLDELYFYYFMCSVDLQHYCESTAVPSVRKARISEIEIPLPPLDEQRRIAAVLDNVSDLIAKRRAQLDKLDELVKARFVEMFGDPLIDSGRYTKVPLGSLVEVGSSKRFFEKEYVREGIPFYRTKEIVELSKGNQITTELFITRQRYDEIKKEYGVPKAGDLLISAVGTIGVIWIVDGKNNFYFKDGNLLRVVTNEKFTPIYLNHLLETLIGAYKLRMSSGTAYAALTISALKEMLVYEVPIEEQKRFASFVEQTDKSKLTIQQSLDKLEILEKALMQEYFG